MRKMRKEMGEIDGKIYNQLANHLDAEKMKTWKKRSEEKKSTTCPAAEELLRSHKYFVHLKHYETW